TFGMDFYDAVRTRFKVGELVVAFGIRHRAAACVVAAGVEQLQRDLANAFFGATIEHTVVRAIVVHPTAQLHAKLLAEVVSHTMDIGPDDNLTNRVGTGFLAPFATYAATAVVISNGLVLVHLVHARREVDELVLATGVGVGG